jgi:hypothetical protein
MYAYGIVMVVSDMLTNILPKMVIYWSKLVKDNKLKHQHLSFTLDGVLKMLLTYVLSFVIIKHLKIVFFKNEKQ